MCIRFLKPALLLLLSTAVLSGSAFQTAGPVRISEAARAALKSPPENLPENVRLELENAWKAAAAPLLSRMLNDPQLKAGIEVKSGSFESKPYLLFHAQGVSENSSRRTLIEIYLGAPGKIEQNYGRWFRPVSMGDMSIRTADFYGDRAVYCTLTEDGSQAMYWQDGEIYVKVNSTDQVRAFAVQAHTEASNAELYSFPELLLKAPPTAGFDIPSVRANVTGIKFYEAGMDVMPVPERRYSGRFDRAATRAVWWQLDIAYPDPGRPAEFMIHHIWYRPDGSILNEFDTDTRIEAGWTSSNNSNGWGWAEPGQWEPGTYRVELFNEGKKIAEGSFEIAGSGGGGPGPQTYDIPSLRAGVTAVKLYESGGDGVPYQQRVYTQTFAKSTTRYVYWELNLEHPPPGVRKNFQIDAVWFTVDGSIFATQTPETYIEPAWSSSYHQYGWGWGNPGNWTPGSYRIVLYVDGHEVAWQIFAIMDN
jgi:hypothetical protein